MFFENIDGSLYLQLALNNHHMQIGEMHMILVVKKANYKLFLHFP